MNRGTLLFWKYGALVNWVLCVVLLIGRFFRDEPLFEAEVRGLLWFLLYLTLDWRLTSGEGPGHGR